MTLASRDEGARSAFPAFHGRVDQVLARVENVAAVGAGAAAVTAMVLVSLDVIMRYAFASPLTFQMYLTQYYLLVAMVMLALPWGYRTGGAIQIRLLLAALPAPLSDTITRIGLMVSAGYLLAVTWRGWLTFSEALANDEVIMGVIDWPVAWSWIWVPIGCGLLALRLVVDAAAPTLRPIGNAHD
ncbi:TRAP transporter small permease (plasmid) [Skermanella mucosa]|uniref:TRAP transporter small permease n=1 Tax=Skermanella mucosa TaxID=1789672 RepID=UPI00192AD0F6|nr:TRAP transporter small permease [Skermanella mucosa]UEM24493.1 TRAP transporter small permease [Skermanella mucosa]